MKINSPKDLIIHNIIMEERERLWQIFEIAKEFDLPESCVKFAIDEQIPVDEFRIKAINIYVHRQNK